MSFVSLEESSKEPFTGSRRDMIAPRVMSHHMVMLNTKDKTKA